MGCDDCPITRAEKLKNIRRWTEKLESSSLVPSRRDTNENAESQKHPRPGGQVDFHLYVGNPHRASCRLRRWRQRPYLKPQSNSNPRRRGKLSPSTLW